MESQRQVAVFLTAIPDEYKAVRAFIDEPEKQEHQGALFECGQFAPEGIEPWRVVVAELGEGTENAAVLTERAIQHFRPTHVFFVGVAGGVKDVQLGDVVAATKVYGCESGKEEAAFSPRPELGHATFAMEQQARSVSRGDDWVARIKPHRPAAAPASLVKPIASGNKVVADTDSATYQLIRHQYGDAVAVEMEGIGFFKAVKANTGIQAIAIRGISDLIDEKAQSDQAGWQPRAAAHAAAFAFEMLARMGRAKENSEQTGGFGDSVANGADTREHSLGDSSPEPPFSNGSELRFPGRDVRNDAGRFDVFLCHNSQDKPEVRELYERLRQRRLRPWLDEKELRPGQRWQPELERQISGIPAVAVCVGPDEIGPWQDMEMNAYIDHFVKTPGRSVIPTILPGLKSPPELPMFLNAFTWVDFRDGFSEEGLDDLQSGITGVKPERREAQGSSAQHDRNAGWSAETERDLSGTLIPPGAFDSILADRIRPILNVDRLEAFRTSIAVEAKQKLPGIESDDPVDALFHPKLALEDGIACLALAYSRCKETLEWEDETRLNAVRKAAKQVLGWLVLRAVDSAWLARNWSKLRQGEGIVLTLALEKDCAVEVILARSEERPALFEAHPGSRWVMGRENVRFGTEAGIYGRTRDEVLRELWRIAQMGYQPRVIGPKETRDLANKLKARARQNRYHYIAVSLDDPGQPLQKEDWLEVQREFPQLKLVFLQLGAQGEALLLDESSLTTQIEAFLEELGEK